MPATPCYDEQQNVKMDFKTVTASAVNFNNNDPGLPGVSYRTENEENTALQKSRIMRNHKGLRVDVNKANGAHRTMGKISEGEEGTSEESFEPEDHETTPCIEPDVQPGIHRSHDIESGKRKKYRTKRQISFRSIKTPVPTLVAWFSKKRTQKCIERIKTTVIVVVLFALVLLITDRILLARSNYKKGLFDLGYQHKPDVQEQPSSQRHRAEEKTSPPPSRQTQQPCPVTPPEQNEPGNINGIEAVLDTTFIRDPKGHTVFYKPVNNEHYSGVHYQNGYFIPSVTGYYDVYSLLSIDLMEATEESNFITHCVWIEDIESKCRRIVQKKNWAGPSEVHELRMYVEKDQKVHVTINDMEVIFNSENDSKFKMFLAQEKQDEK